MHTSGLKGFVSYSHKDEPLRLALDTHLASLASQGIIEFWNDRAIEAGSEWACDIREHLANADIILLLISSDFVASPYCYRNEMRQALERHEKGLARMIPVILRPVDWHHMPFAKIQALPKDGRPVTSWPNQDEAFVNVALGVRAAANTLLDKREGRGESSPEVVNRHLNEQHPLEGSHSSRRMGVKITGRENDTIAVTVKLLSTGESIRVEIPLDMTVESIIIELTASMQLPRIEIDRRPVEWDLRSEALGCLLDPRTTLRENAVPDGDTLTFMRICLAG